MTSLKIKLVNLQERNIIRVNCGKTHFQDNPYRGTVTTFMPTYDDVEGHMDTYGEESVAFATEENLMRWVQERISAFRNVGYEQTHFVIDGQDCSWVIE